MVAAKKESEHRVKNVTARFTWDEYKRVKAYCKRHDLLLAPLIRDMMLDLATKDKRK